MQHKKRYVIVLTAWVLVLVTVLATPASAANNLNISQFLKGSSVSGSKINKEYFIPYSSTSTYQISGMTTSYKLSTFDSGYGSTDCSYTTDSSLSFLSFSICPITYSSFFSSDVNNQYFLNDVLSDEASSFVVKSGFNINSDCSLKGEIYYSVSVTTKSGNKVNFISDYTSFSVSALDYHDVYYSFDLAQKCDISDIASFTFHTVVKFYNVPSGASVRVLPITLPDAVDDLSTGVMFFVEDIKTQEAPVFTKNLTTPSIVYLVGNSPNPLSVTATVSDGGVISYQWYKSVSSTNVGAPISGATGNIYSPDTTYEHEGYYYCVATSTLNGETKSTVSNIVHLSVVKLPLKPQIVNDLNDGAVIEYYQGATAGNLLFGCVVTDGGTLSYQWFERSSPSAASTKISGATASTYRPPTDTIGIKYYYCVASNKKGSYSESVTSGLVGVRIISPPDPALPPVITSDLDDEYIYQEGNTGILSIGAVSPDGGSLKYQWFYYTDDDSVFTSLPGDSPTLILDTSKPGKYYYFCVIQNSLNDTSAAIQSNTAAVTIEADDTDSLLDIIIGRINDLLDGIISLPQKLLDGIKGLFVPDANTMAAYQDRWFSLLASRFGAIYQAVTLIDEFGQAISDQAARGVVDFPEVTINLAGTPFVFGGWQVDVVPDGFDVIFDALKLMIDIVATLAFVNGLRHRFEGILGGE